jgi:hypothetical protein
MKTRFLIIILCLACSASFAQKKKAATKAPVKKTVAAQQPKTTGAPNTALGAGATAQKAVLDTGKKTPAKPFDRPLDGYYKKTNIASAKVTPYANLRESDVTFAKRVWREIDLREKMNQYLLSPKQRLIDVLMAAIDAGELTAYDPTASKEDPNGDSFSKPMTGAQARSKMSGIAPLVKPKAAGLDLDYQPAFWLYFPEARPILATKEAVSRNNDATGLSFDDIFVKRLFSSYIVKQSNDKDERIRDYAQGIDKLYEAERIKKTLADYELNLWKYSE